MHKTVSISLGGLSFVLDENAYDKLKIYLGDIKKYLHNIHGLEDIIVDIEIRISEIFREQLKFREVVNENDINHIIEIMGNPNQYIYEDDKFDDTYYKKTKNNKIFNKQQFANKGLFKDPDNYIITGLSSGLAHYIGVDPLLIRAIWITLAVIGIFTNGESLSIALFFYLTLYIFIPKARGISEKLQMHGQPININTLKKNIEQNSEPTAKRIKPISRIFRSIQRLLRRCILFFLGSFFIVVGISFIIIAFCLIFTIWPINIPTELFGCEIVDKWTNILVKILVSVSLIIPGAFFSFIGIKCYWGKAKVSRKITTNTLITWLIALIGIGFISFKTVYKSKNSTDITNTNDNELENNLRIEENYTKVLIDINGIRIEKKDKPSNYKN